MKRNQVRPDLGYETRAACAANGAAAIRSWLRARRKAKPGRFRTRPMSRSARMCQIADSFLVIRELALDQAGSLRRVDGAARAPAEHGKLAHTKVEVEPESGEARAD